MYPTSSLFLLGLVAQGIEHRFPKPGVASSNLAEAAFINYIYIDILILSVNKKFTILILQFYKKHLH